MTAPVESINKGDDLVIRSCDFILCGFLVGLTLNASAQQSTPAASAPPPLVGTLAGHTDWPAAKNPGDVDTVDHLVASLYDVVSGPAGQRDWDRFRALFVPDGRLAWIVPESAATKDAPARKGDAVFLTPDMFMQQNDPYFKTNGFFERSIVKRVEEFGNLVEVWSTKESRDAKDDVQPSSRGIDSFQIVHAHGRFWIASLIFDDERPGVTLPEKYLPPGNDESKYEGKTNFEDEVVEYRDAGNTEECFKFGCGLYSDAREPSLNPTFWGEPKLH
jgi:hypothetical protein